ncbi:MAG TPA: hypothetical protein VGD91_24290, partial [Trebonia sp.]
AADAGPAETTAVTPGPPPPAGPAVRTVAPPIALPAGPAAVVAAAFSQGPAASSEGPAAPLASPPFVPPEPTPTTPPDGLPVMRRPPAPPDDTGAPVAPDASQSDASQSDVAAAPAEPAPPAAAPAPATRPGIRYASRTREYPVSPAAAREYWEAEDAGPFAGLVYSSRKDDGGAAEEPEAGKEPDDDASPLATVPFAAVPRLNRVRSTPAPPEDEDDKDAQPGR